MGGGSLNYLYIKEPGELIYHLDDLEQTEKILLQEGYSDVAKDTRRLIEYIIASKNKIEVLQENLQDVFKAVEWWQSGDSSKDDVRKAVENYRNR